MKILSIFKNKFNLQNVDLKENQRKFTFKAALGQDTFEKTNAQPLSFTGGSCIPSEMVKNLGKKLKVDLISTNDEKKVYNLIRDYFEQVVDWLTPISREDKNLKLMRVCRHETVNLYDSGLELHTNPEFKSMLENVPDYLNYQKNYAKAAVKNINETMHHFSRLEKWFFNPDAAVPAEEIHKELQYMLKTHNGNVHNNIKMANPADLMLMIKKPMKVYDMISQALLNAVKYSEGKPIKFSLVKSPKGEKSYFIEILNKGTKAIPDDEIDKILQGTGHRASITKDIISGTGTGFKEIIRLAKEIGRESDVPNLIEKGRANGVLVRIPVEVV